MPNYLKSIIVDDERLARKELRLLLKRFKEIAIVGEAGNLTEATRIIEAEKPDVVFLDIQLPGEIGFNLLERTGVPFKTIFVTAYDAYAQRAFEVNALDYLMKPVNPDRLKQTVEKLVNAGAEKPLVDQVAVRRRLEFDDRLLVETGTRSFFLKINTISHIISSGDYTEVFTTTEGGGGQKFLIEKTVREWEERLPEKHFVRIHRCCIINLERVALVENWFNNSYQIYLQNIGEPFTVSRRYAAKLKIKFG
jgi:two-component system LytT family response regulator